MPNNLFRKALQAVLKEDLNEQTATIAENEYQVTDKLIKLLKQQASRKTNVEQYAAGGDEWFNPWDASGGNFDDAYQMGVDDGGIEMARTILDHLEGGR